jgi:cobalt/nickel transport system permease protein
LREFTIENKSRIHKIDARVKVIFTLAFIIFLNLTPAGAWPAYVLFFCLILSLILLARLGVGEVLKRSLLAIPFVIAALPLIFTGPAPVFPVLLPFGWQFSYSSAGTVRFASIVLKSWISMLAAILLATTTRFPDLLVGLQQLKMPKILIAVIGLMWRYLFLISGEATRMINARKSRSPASQANRRAGGTIWWRAQVTGGMAGSLFLRSIERSERVYTAMLSRGYNGEQKTLSSPSLSGREWTLLAVGIIILTLLWLLGIVTGA